MPMFKYTYAHDDGAGEGHVNAETEAEAVKQLTSTLQSMSPDKLENLRFEFEEVPPAEDDEQPEPEAQK